jgi:hypothetical protein
MIRTNAVPEKMFPDFLLPKLYTMAKKFRIVSDCLNSGSNIVSLHRKDLPTEIVVSYTRGIMLEKV